MARTGAARASCVSTRAFRGVKYPAFQLQIRPRRSFYSNDDKSQRARKEAAGGKMDRRTLLMALAAGIPAFAMPSTLLAQSVAPRLRITDIKVARIRVVRDLGVYESRFHDPPARF